MNPFDVLPTTFHIKKIHDEEWNKLKELSEGLEKEDQLWIVKPA